MNRCFASGRSMLREKKVETDEMLKLMRIVNDNPHITQRELSFNLGLSLGKVNFLMKAMMTTNIPAQKEGKPG